MGKAFRYVDGALDEDGKLNPRGCAECAKFETTLPAARTEAEQADAYRKLQAKHLMHSVVVVEDGIPRSVRDLDEWDEFIEARMR